MLKNDSSNALVDCTVFFSKDCDVQVCVHLQYDDDPMDVRTKKIEQISNTVNPDLRLRAGDTDSHYPLQILCESTGVSAGRKRIRSAGARIFRAHKRVKKSGCYRVFDDANTLSPN